VNSLLHAAEELEGGAACERVSYLQGLGVLGSSVLDVGCGNGYSIRELRQRGFVAVGVDYSFYRMSRWIAEGRADRHLIVAAAAALPFATGRFETVISSGMLEHIGVDEEAAPYRITALPDKHRVRAATITELLRVSAGPLVLDFPNGWFPVDFWHGDSLGAFRVHRVPDALNPSLGELRSYLPGSRVTVLPLRDRLRFRQVSRKLWGRILAPVVRFTLRMLDRVPRGSHLLSFLYPYLVVRVEREETEGR
jgi:SAM-dependent methyltransferase